MLISYFDLFINNLLTIATMINVAERKMIDTTVAIDTNRIGGSYDDSMIHHSHEQLIKVNLY